MHSSIYKHENQINLNKRSVQKNRCKGRLFILIEQLNYLEAYSGDAKTPIILWGPSRDLGLQVPKVRTKHFCMYISSTLSIKLF